MIFHLVEKFGLLYFYCIFSLYLLDKLCVIVYIYIYILQIYEGNLCSLYCTTTKRRGNIQYISITVLSFNFIGKNTFEYSPKKKE